jgi:phage tail sheath protein FI
MPSYLHPGVYMEEIPSGAKPIEGCPPRSPR